jgi:Clp protease
MMKKNNRINLALTAVTVHNVEYTHWKVHLETIHLFQNRSPTQCVHMLPISLLLITLQVAQMIKKNNRMEEALTAVTGHTREQIRLDFQRDFYLSAAEAVQYGVIDKMLLPRDKSRKMEATKDLQVCCCCMHAYMYMWLLQSLGT